MAALSWLRVQLRDWLLTEEQEAIAQLDTKESSLEDRVSSLEGDWNGIKAALEDADLWGEDAQLDDVEILIVAGRQNLVQGGNYQGRLYLSGNQHRVDHPHFDIPDSRGDA